ncbi:receptor-like serine/threonine-protein kinase ALE2 isoform X2 [Ipomoea triloba]|uniref:receptor-like serine/threonine-protein kinase ALE2 isoform X2 n=1 Tax=Ipomoea triloba TaxID=35885 RepID=UPI00125E97F0|nr:receptor-like serine/threonine-protein kinase ALE2 isoform X2 [Ipomoea triloba]
MAVEQSFMLLRSFLILTALSLQVSAGFNLPSWRAASVLVHFKEGNGNGNAHLIDPASHNTSVPTIFGWKRHSPSEAPNPHEIFNPSHYSDAPSKPTFRQQFMKWMHRFAFPPSYSSSKHNRGRNRLNKFAPGPGPSSQGHWHSISPSQSSFPSSASDSLAPQASATAPSSHFNMPALQPASWSSWKDKKMTPPPLPLLTLPPPPPNQDCASVRCTDPLTYTPPGSLCGCVRPIEVGLRLSITLYAFFPLVSELSKEISASILLKRSQVRIMGANAVNQQLEKTIVLVNLVPTEENFNATTAFAIYDKFWKREVSLKKSLFGSCDVVYVRYPGLPPSPPSLPSSGASIDDQPDPGNNRDGSRIKPIGVDVSRPKKSGMGRNMITVIALSSVTAFVVCVGVIWLLSLKLRGRTYQAVQPPHNSAPSHGKASGAVGSLTIGTKPSSTSMSINSSILAYAGTAKIFSAYNIEKATDNFNATRILGEGGFGLVYRGTLDDGREVAVKILKRYDRHGSREFLAEVEMLSRLHHRNLVKLIGICTEDHCRCLVYELVPNGSVESHLHGLDMKASRLDWYARMKIALGAAQGLAYLHEDSNPRVIHRDFKSSNILLEHDFTPKVSDFGLARTALDEGNKQISTHVMGTFGYLAPEYAMTGHLLVKSDVYSYGVVLLELLTGRKPVDLSQPPGQENLVAWARPLLTTKEGLEMLIDSGMKSDIPFDSVIKFAAIAAMCVQPEASHRPFMGEVVQALKLICNEFDETREPMSRSCSQEELCIDMDSRETGEFVEGLHAHEAISIYDSSFDAKIPLSAGDLKSSSARLEAPESEPIKREFYSAPLGTSTKRNFWQRLKILSKGGTSEDGFSSNL